MSDVPISIIKNCQEIVFFGLLPHTLLITPIDRNSKNLNNVVVTIFNLVQGIKNIKFNSVKVKKW